MIFRTITNESTGAIKSVGLFGKTIDDLKKSLSNIKTNGLFNSIFNDSFIDDNAITKYNLAIREAIASNASMAEKQQIMKNAMEGTNRVTAQLISSTNGATVSTEALTAAQKASTLAAKAQSTALKALSIAGNIATSMLIMKGIQLAITAIDNFIHRVEKAQEALQEAVDSFESATKEVDDLNEELKTCNERISELQRLVDKGTISVADAQELELLRQTNDELERKIALKQADQIQAQKEVLRDNNKLLNTKVRSSYSYTDVNVGRGIGSVANSVLPEEELALAIDKYKELLQRLSDETLQDSERNSIQGQIEYASTKIQKMYDIISPSIKAYKSLIDSGYELDDVEKARYEGLVQHENAYLAYNYNVNGTREAFSGLNTVQQRNILLNRLLAQGLSEVQAKSIIGNISTDDYNNFWDKDFSFIPPQMSDYTNAAEYGKAYAEAWLNGVKTTIENTDENPISLGNVEH